MYQLHYAPDNASLIVRLLLEEIEAPYTTKLVDRSEDAQKSPDYRALNPMGLIPTLETPSGPVFETAAILLYLADRHGLFGPAPDHPLRGTYLAWLFATSNGLHADMRQLFYNHLYVSSDPKGHASLTRARITAHLDRYEALAGTTPWFGNEIPSALDIYIAVILRWLALYPKGRTDWFTLATWPNLLALSKRIEGRASMQAAQLAEGLGPTPLSAPRHANPPEGSAT